jgi:hypothetical protein
MEVTEWPQLGKNCDDVFDVTFDDVTGVILHNELSCVVLSHI